MIISHRGNINGANKDLENNPDHIKSLLKSKIEVEIDVWLIDGQAMLGHDNPQYLVDYRFFEHDKLWCHAKNLDALIFMLQNKIHCFWHQEDDYTITSRGYVWTFPNKPVSSYRSVIVDTSKNWKEKNYNCERVCSDYLL